MPLSTQRAIRRFRPRLSASPTAMPRSYAGSGRQTDKAQHIAATRSERYAHAELACPLQDGIRDNTIEPTAARVSPRKAKAPKSMEMSRPR